MYSFSVAAMTNDNTCSGLKQHGYLTVLEASLKSALWVEAGVRAAPLEAPGEPLLSPPLAFGGCCRIAAPPWPSAPSSEDPCEDPGRVQDGLSGPGPLTLIASAEFLRQVRSHVHSSRDEGGRLLGDQHVLTKPQCMEQKFWGD